MPDRDYITVSELNRFIKSVVEAEDLFSNVPVVGEVSSISVRNDNCFFTLKDQKAQINVTMFGTTGKIIPKNGEQVLVRGRIEYYAAAGKINVVAYEITPLGTGYMHAQLMELKKRMEEDGLFREEHKKIIPSFPRKIGIITSVKGAAIQDILSTLARNHSKQDLTIIDVNVQGDKCVDDVVCALEHADSYGFDVILLTRGGGSFEDLYSFNDERILRAIYRMNTPIITGVGHETDYTLCDYVSDYRAITPTAAAEKIAVNHEMEKQAVYSKISFIRKHMESIFLNEKTQYNHVTKTIAFKANQSIGAELYSIKNMLEIVKNSIEKEYVRNQHKYEQLCSVLEQVNPIKLLNRGYFRILYQDKIVNSLCEIPLDSEISITSENEKITARVIKKEEL